MKARSREINIFNMSLLDILCGALGAFCFMMLVLFPYYSQDKGTAKRPEVTEGVDPKTFEEAKNRIRQLEEDLQKFKNYADQLEAQNKQLQAQQREQRGDLERMQDRAESAEMRNPILAFAMFPGTQKDEYLEVWMTSNREGNDGKKDDPIDPTKSQPLRFVGDRASSAPSALLSTFMARDTPKGSEFRIFVKVIKLNQGHEMWGSVIVQANDVFQALDVRVLKQGVAIPIGLVKVDAEHKGKFELLIPAENAAKQP
jgi:hypothetical protein